MILPAWRRHISGPSLAGRRRRLIGAKHGRLQEQQTGGQLLWLDNFKIH